MKKSYVADTLNEHSKAVRVRTTQKSQQATAGWPCEKCRHCTWVMVGMTTCSMGTQCRNSVCQRFLRNEVAWFFRKRTAWDKMSVCPRQQLPTAMEMGLA